MSLSGGPLLQSKLCGNVKCGVKRSICPRKCPAFLGPKYVRLQSGRHRKDVSTLHESTAALPGDSDGFPIDPPHGPQSTPPSSPSQNKLHGQPDNPLAEPAGGPTSEQAPRRRLWSARLRSLYELLSRIAKQCIARCRAFIATITRFWLESLKRLESWYMRTIFCLAFATMLLTGLVNVWGVPSINHSLMPQATTAATTILEREVELGTLRWLSPLGLLGMTPLASVGPVSVGPHALEKSSATIPEVIVFVDVLQSLLQQKVMLNFQADKADVSMAQMNNFSWYGYPEDTHPSARHFVPGLQKFLDSKKSAGDQKDVKPRPALSLSSSQSGNLPDSATQKPVEKDDRRRLFPIPPEAAMNFRPAVGNELFEHAMRLSAERKTRSNEVHMEAKRGGTEAAPSETPPAAAGLGKPVAVDDSDSSKRKAVNNRLEQDLMHRMPQQTGSKTQQGRHSKGLQADINPDRLHPTGGALTRPNSNEAKSSVNSSRPTQILARDAQQGSPTKMPSQHPHSEETAQPVRVSRSTVDVVKPASDEHPKGIDAENANPVWKGSQAFTLDSHPGSGTSRSNSPQNRPSLGSSSQLPFQVVSEADLSMAASEKMHPAAAFDTLKTSELRASLSEPRRFVTSDPPASSEKGYRPGKQNQANVKPGPRKPSNRTDVPEGKLTGLQTVEQAARPPKGLQEAARDPLTLSAPTVSRSGQVLDPEKAGSAMIEPTMHAFQSILGGRAHRTENLQRITSQPTQELEASKLPSQQTPSVAKGQDRHQGEGVSAKGEGRAARANKPKQSADESSRHEMERATDFVVWTPELDRCCELQPKLDESSSWKPGGLVLGENAKPSSGSSSRGENRSEKQPGLDSSVERAATSIRPQRFQVYQGLAHQTVRTEEEAPPMSLWARSYGGFREGYNPRQALRRTGRSYLRRHDPSRPQFQTPVVEYLTPASSDQLITSVNDDTEFSLDDSSDNPMMMLPGFVSSSVIPKLGLSRLNPGLLVTEQSATSETVLDLEGGPPQDSAVNNVHNPQDTLDSPPTGQTRKQQKTPPEPRGKSARASLGRGKSPAIMLTKIPGKQAGLSQEQASEQNQPDGQAMLESSSNERKGGRQKRRGARVRPRKQQIKITASKLEDQIERPSIIVASTSSLKGPKPASLHRHSPEVVRRTRIVRRGPRWGEEWLKHSRERLNSLIAKLNMPKPLENVLGSTPQEKDAEQTQRDSKSARSQSRPAGGKRQKTGHMPSLQSNPTKSSVREETVSGPHHQVSDNLVNHENNLLYEPRGLFRWDHLRDPQEQPTQAPAAPKIVRGQYPSVGTPEPEFDLDWPCELLLSSHLSHIQGSQHQELQPPGQFTATSMAKLKPPEVRKGSAVGERQSRQTPRRPLRHQLEIKPTSNDELILHMNERDTEHMLESDSKPVTVALSVTPEAPSPVMRKTDDLNATALQPGADSKEEPPAKSGQTSSNIAATQNAVAVAPKSPRPISEPRISKPKAKIQSSKRARVEEDVEPRYKPGSQSLSASRGGLKHWLWERIKPAVGKIKLPAMGVDALRIREGELSARMVGESIPRRISNVDLTLRLANNYHDMVLDVTGNAHLRDPASDRCTMSAADPVRHLRDAKTPPITRLATDVPSSSPATPSNQANSLEFSLGHSMKQHRESLHELHTHALARLSPQEQQDPELDASGFATHPGASNEPTAPTKGRAWWQTGRYLSDKRPQGGRIQVRVNSKGLHLAYPDTHIDLWGKDLHAPMADRVLELPMDVYGGRFDGNLSMHAYNEATWKLPLFNGRVKCRDMGFHFWEATDDFSKTDIDLLFEGHRLYLHGAKGWFGAVPMSLTGDMDLNPTTGQYRLSATVSDVELNEVRKTLGIKPPPLPVGGAIRGILHVAGPLEQPVFSGTAVATQTNLESLQAMEDSNAKETLMSEPRAAGAYDRIPFASASAIFTMDTSNDIFLLHSLQAEPLDGGQVVGSGRMWVNPIAEDDQRAVRVSLAGEGLPFEPFTLRYLPKGMKLPAPLILGKGTVKGSLEGTLMAPDLKTTWDLPEASASGSLEVSRETTKVTCKAPALDVSAALHVLPPDIDAVKRAVTQAEVTALAAPVLDGLDLDVNFKGLDVLPIFSPPEALEHLKSSQSLRLKLNGRTQFSGSMIPKENKSDKSSMFSGDLSLDKLRVNQLKLSRNLSGTLSVSDDSFNIQAKGSRPDEALAVNLKLPLLKPPETTKEAARSRHSSAGSGLFGIKLADILPIPGFESVDCQGSEDPDLSQEASHDGGGDFSLRCGQMLISAEVNGTASEVDFQVRRLKLDELELASLRGEVEEAGLKLDLEARQGRGQVIVQGPRFSGLQGELLSTAVRWDQDVVRLERANLQQKNSRYEVQGEYVIPANVAIPRSAASMVPTQRDSIKEQSWSPFESSSGRWRIQVNVPNAHMEEILPAARLLSRATSPTPSDYERAKSAFLRGVHEAKLQAQELGRQLEAAAESARMQLSNTLSRNEEALSPSKNAGTRGALPGLQDLKGEWNGAFQAYGGGGGPANMEFDMRGQDWTWGNYALDQAVAQGACHSVEGVKIEEISLRAGDARLLIQGKLLTADQNTTILLTDFPVALLDPLFKTMPALQNAAPAVGSAPAGGQGPGGLSGLTMPFRGSDKVDPSGRTVSPGSFSNSPVNGLLYVRGKIGGSATNPEGDLVVRLFDGAIGPTQLAQAQAVASLNAAQRFNFSMDLAPAEPRAGGVARVTGSVPLAAPSSKAAGRAGQTSEGANDNVEVSMHVKDGGMKLVRILTPDFRWQSGNADVELNLRGQPGNLALEGGMHVSKGTISSPFLKYPMTNTTASIHLADNIVNVENVEAKVGRKGFIKMKGSLPMDLNKKKAASEPKKTARKRDQIMLDMNALEMRLRNSYTGNLDASLRVRNSLTAPILGGDIRLSRGVAMLTSQGAAELEKGGEPEKQDDFVQKAFTVLSRNDGIAKRLAQPQDEVVPKLMMENLQVRLGPELRAMYPVVVNLGISGDIQLNGPADPTKMRLTGAVKIESGEINLVAAQLIMDREHANQVVFDGQEGLDPLVDLSLRGAQIRALIQGRASTWHRHLLLTPITAPAGEAAELLQPSEAARIFEGQLASALLAEDGQLALSNLAVSAAHGFMPKIQTQGQLGQARWRLVSAPSIPGLLSLDPTRDPTSLLSSLTMGTEVEVQFGNSLQAAMARKLRESDIATQWTLNYQLNSKLRMQFTVASVPPYPRTLLFQYSEDSS